MGKALYPNSLDAIRELLQNSVDACLLRDAIHLDKALPSQPSKDGRIVVRYEENPNSEDAVLSISDSGIGMDRWVIENYFLKVGKSYYKSADFMRTQAVLRNHKHDFYPVSEFGIGFLSCFMLCDRLEVETCSCHSQSGDQAKRTLKIDGVGGLISVKEERNKDNFSGTKITLNLKSERPSWDQVRDYITAVAQDLPYPLVLEHIVGTNKNSETLNPSPLSVQVPYEFEESALHIPVSEEIFGLQGEIVIFCEKSARAAVRENAEKRLVWEGEEGELNLRNFDRGSSSLLRGGFKVSPVPGLPERYSFAPTSSAILRIDPQKSSKKELLRTDISRSRFIDTQNLGEKVTELWVKWLLDNIEEVEKVSLGSFNRIRSYDFKRMNWLESYTAMDVYRLIRTMWITSNNARPDKLQRVEDWENGKSDQCFVGTDYLHFQLMKIVLPQVAELAVDSSDGKSFWLVSLNKDWRNILHANKSFITTPISWDIFATYRDRIKDLLYYAYPGDKYLNAKFKQRLLAVFSLPEAKELRNILDSIPSAIEHKYPILLHSKQKTLWQKALAEFGNEKIGGRHGQWSLNELAANKNVTNA